MNEPNGYFKFDVHLRPDGETESDLDKTNEYERISVTRKQFSGMGAEEDYGDPGFTEQELYRSMRGIDRGNDRGVKSFGEGRINITVGFPDFATMLNGLVGQFPDNREHCISDVY